MEPLISIIIPIYNVELYIHRCIKSVLVQTYTNLEIILVNDGSPDNCGRICDEYAQKDERIRVIHKKNGGLSNARNAGIAVAKGEYIGFVDSDDYIEPSMYEKLLNAILTQNTKLSMSAFYCEHEDGKLDELNNVQLIPNGVLLAEEVFVKLSEGNGWFFTVAWNKLYHKSLLNPRFYPNGKYHEDEFTIAPLLWEAKKISCISDKCYHYIYMREGSITGSNTDLRHLDALEALYERCCFYHSIGKDQFMSEDRAYYFTMLEKYTLTPGNDTLEMKKRLKEIRKLYEKIPIMRKTERFKLFLFKINPKFEYWLVHILRKVRT